MGKSADDESRKVRNTTSACDSLFCYFYVCLAFPRIESLFLDLFGFCFQSNWDWIVFAAFCYRKCTYAHQNELRRNTPKTKKRSSKRTKTCKRTTKKSGIFYWMSDYFQFSFHACQRNWQLRVSWGILLRRFIKKGRWTPLLTLQQ